MSIESALFERLKAEISLVSNRVYAGIAPQTVSKPYLTTHKLSPGFTYAHDGRSKLGGPRFQVSVFASTYASAKAVEAEVIAALEGWKTTKVQGAFVESAQDLHEQETGLYHVPIDAFIWHTY